MAEYRVSFEAISHRSIEDLSRDFYEQFDGLVTERLGRIVVAAYAEADSGLAAGMALIEKLERIGFCLVRVDQDLVDAPEVASRLGVTRQAVNLWAKGTRGDSFPHPIGSPGGKRIWAWGQITEWARQRQKFAEAPSLTQDEASLVDAYLARRRVRAGGHPGTRVDWALGPSIAKRHSPNVNEADDYPVRSLHSEVTR